MANQALTLEVGQNLDLVRDGPLRRLEHPADAEIHDVESLEAEVPEVVVHARDQVVLAVRRLPRSVVAPDRPELGDDHQPFGIWVQRLPDDLVSDVRAVEVAGVDVVDAGRDGLAKNSHGLVRVFGRSKDTGAGQLHRTVAHPVDRQRRAGEGKPAAELRFAHGLAPVRVGQEQV